MICCGAQYHANQFLPMSDDAITERVMEYLTTCIDEFGDAKVLDRAVIRCPQAVTHFFPGEQPSGWVRAFLSESPARWYCPSNGKYFFPGELSQNSESLFVLSNLLRGDTVLVIASTSSLVSCPVGVNSCLCRASSCKVVLS